MADTIVTTPDGNSVKLPEYAMEKTMQDILSQLKGLYKLDDGDSKTLQQLLQNARDAASEQRDANKEADSDREKSLEYLRQLNESASKSTIFSTDNLLKNLKAVTNGLGNLASGLAGIASGIVSTALETSTELGNAIRDLTDVGVGFNDMTGTTAELISNMQMLGLNLIDAVDQLNEYSTAVQTIGKTTFAEMQRQFIASGDFARQFGLSIKESVQLLGEDLELRAQLGVMNQLSADQQARSSQELYRNQVAASMLLGKSIDKLRGNSQAFVRDSLKFQLNMRRLDKIFTDGGLSAESFRVAVESATTGIEGAGFDSSMAQRIIDATLHPIALAAEDADLLQALSALEGMGPEGAALVNKLRDIQQGINSGDIKEVARANEQLKTISTDFVALGKTINVEDYQQFLNALGSGNKAAEDFFKGVIASASASEKLNVKLDGLAQAVTVYENALDGIIGGFKGSLSNVMGALSSPMSALAEAFTTDAVRRDEAGRILDENGKIMLVQKAVMNELTGKMEMQTVAARDLYDLTEEEQEKVKAGSGIMGIFRDSIKLVSDTLRNALGGSAGKMADMIRRKVIPVIQNLTADLNEFIEGIKNADDPVEYIKQKIATGWNTKVVPMLLGAVESLWDQAKPGLKSGIDSLLQSMKQGFLDFINSPTGLVVAIGALTAILGPTGALAVAAAALGVTMGTAISDIQNYVLSKLLGRETTVGNEVYNATDAVRGWFGDSDEDRINKANQEALTERLKGILEFSGGKIGERALKFYEEQGLDIDRSKITVIDNEEYKKIYSEFTESLTKPDEGKAKAPDQPKSPPTPTAAPPQAQAQAQSNGSQPSAKPPTPVKDESTKPKQPQPPESGSQLSYSDEIMTHGAEAGSKIIEQLLMMNDQLKNLNDLTRKIKTSSETTASNT